MKSPYYVATIVNAYRRAIDQYYESRQASKPYSVSKDLSEELLKASHRNYTSGFMFNDNKSMQNLNSSAQEQTSKFIAVVKEVQKGKILVEMRNRFMVGDQLEILSPSSAFKKTIKLEKMEDINGNPLTDAKKVCELVWIYTDVGGILPLDILRK